MKSLKYLLCLLPLAACTGILEKEPIATLDAGSYFQTEDDAVQAINAAYGSLPFNNDNKNFYWGFAVLTADEAITGGDGSRPGLTELDAFTYTPRTEEFNDFWKVQYAGITQCNVVLDNIGKIDIPQNRRDQISGEALFLRAYYYFLLTQVFGDVPLFTGIVPPDQLKAPRTPKATIYAQIEADCERAAGLLPAQYPAAETGRATKGAAYALAAKAYLYEKKWDKVLEYVGKVKGLGIYALMPDYEDNFRKNTQNNAESVWEIQHANLELGVGNFLNQWWASKKFEGYGFAEATEEYVLAFEPDDPRRKFTVAMNNEDYFGVVYKPSFSSTKYGVRKYLQPKAEVTQKADGDINYTAIRFAEVLLWEAEALTELGRVQEAQAPLEQVRARARAQAANPATALPPVTTTDQQVMREALRHERRVELGFEMHRFFDLVRWGIAAQTLPGFQAGKHEVFPLPQTEVDLNPALVQNAGY
ncbi:MAG: RagB/SusD family nutrient uptake outer membrane protein [Thermoanaerobaculia bacterium]|nr:RagB/SusD family nutrient uptake outer membrane protein [Thermoanaerobaculia bacterium]